MKSRIAKYAVLSLLAGFIVTASPVAPAMATSSYTVTYDANSAQPQTGVVTGSISPSTITAGDSLALPDGTALTRQGFTFAGWSTTPTGSAVTSPYTPSSSLTLYAKWTIPAAARLIGSSGSIVTVTNPNNVANGTNCTTSGIRGVTSDGTYIYFRSSINITYMCQVTMAGVLVKAANVAGLTFLVDSRALAFSGGCIYIRPDVGGSTSVDCIDTSDWTLNVINLPAGKPFIAGGVWLNGNLIAFPDGRIGAVSAPNQSLPTGTGAGQCPSGMYCKVLRLYTLAGSGKTSVPTFSEDIVLTDTQSGWPDDDHGIATDGTYLYEIHFNAAYKVWALRSGTPSYLVFNGEGTGACGATTGVSGTNCPINSPINGALPLTLSNATYLGRNHVTGQYIMGDYNAAKIYESAAAVPPAGPGNPAPTYTSITPITGTSNGGTTAIITGTGLLATTSVTIGGVSATIVNVTATKITIVTPVTTTGTKDVVITASNGTVTGAAAFTVTAPFITSVGPNGDTLTVNTGSTNNLLSTYIANPIVITGYDPTHILRVVLSTNLGTLNETATDTLLSLPTGSLNVVNGYQNPITNSAASIAMSGTMANLNLALATVRLNAPTTGTATISVDVSDAGTGTIAYNPDNGRYYQYVTTAVTWDAAYQAVTGSPLSNDLTVAPTSRSRATCPYTFNGMCGYFATVKSAKENAFVASKVGLNAAWLGGSDRVQQGKWVWSDPMAPEYNKQFSDMYSGYAGRPDQVKASSPYNKGTGSSPTGQCVSYTITGDATNYCYAPWNSSEPNNFNGNETVLQILSGGTGLWNDLNEFSSSQTLGYIVEYGGNGEALTYAAAHRTITASIVPAATTVAVTGPGGGLISTPSRNFTVAPNGYLNGTVTITGQTVDSSTAVVAAFSPITLTFAGTATAQTFNFTPHTNVLAPFVEVDTVTVTVSLTGGGTLPSTTVIYSTAPATNFAFTGPSTLTANQASGTFTLNPNGVFGDTITVTVSGGGLTQTLEFPFTPGDDSKTFTITPTGPGPVVLTATTTATGITPATVVLTLNVIASGYTLTAPSTGLITVPSTNFTISPNGSYTGYVTISINGAGLSQTVYETFTASSAPQSFTITPTRIGRANVTIVSNPTLGTDTSTVYVATTAPTLYVNPNGGNIGQGIPASYTFVLLTDPTDPNSVIDPSTLSGYTAPVCTSSYTTSAVVGAAPFMITCTGGSATGYLFDTSATDFLDVVPAITFTYTTPLNATVGTAITTALPTLVSGTVTQWQISPALPSPLSFNIYTGEITGTPTSASPSTTYTITANNDGVVGIFTITIAIANAIDPWTPPAPTIPTVTPPSLSGGTPTNFNVTTPGGTGYTVSGGSLPAGLTLNPTTGVISGTPTGSGPYSFTVTVTNVYGLTSTVTLSGVIAPATTTGSGSGSTGTGSGTTGSGTTGSGTTGSGSTGSGTTGSGSTTSGLPTLAPVTPPPSVTSGLGTGTGATRTGAGPISGNVSVLVNGATVMASLAPNPTNNGYVLSAPGWTLNLNPLDSTGNPVPLNSNSQIVLAPSRLVGVAGDGFLANSTVNVYLFSTPILLGTVTTDATGKFKANFPVDPKINVGNHVIQVDGLSPAKEVRSASVGLLVAATSAVSGGSSGTSNSSTASTNLTKVGATGVVPFTAAKIKIESAQQVSLVKSYKFAKGASVLITGYASKTSGEDDLRVSLDRALETKNALAKLHPDLVIKAVGGGVTKNPLCANFNNQCSVVKITR